MNIIRTVETIHLRASRSLDVTMLSNFIENNLKQCLLYIYNYDGIHFRVFDELNDFFNFLDGNNDHCICEFDSETEMENYLIEEFIIK